MIVKAIKTRVFKKNENLESFIFRHIPNLKDKSIVVITSKILALSQGRTAPNGPGQKLKWIKKESKYYIKTPWCYLTFKDGHWCPNAGIDESNSESGELILWPTEMFKAAFKIRAALARHYHVKNVGVLITDSRIFPLRSGVTGVSLAYAGFGGLRNYIGKADIFGRKLKMTKTNVADSLASAAVLEMGEGSEQRPVAIIEGPSVEFNAKQVEPKSLQMSPKEDLYAPLFAKFNRRRRK